VAIVSSVRAWVFVSVVAIGAAQGCGSDEEPAAANPSGGRAGSSSGSSGKSGSGTGGSSSGRSGVSGAAGEEPGGGKAGRTGSGGTETSAGEGGTDEPGNAGRGGAGASSNGGRSGAANGGEGGDGGDGPVSETDIAWIYEEPYNPIDIGLTLDAARAIEAVVPLTGGTLTATGADGTTYTLVIPDGALKYETPIRITPVATITGMPFGNGPLAVHLEPEGLSLNDFATLTITPAVALPENERLLIGYQADGRGLAVPLPDPNSSEIRIKLLHFSGAGVTRGLLGDLEAVRRRLGGNVEARLSSEISLAIQTARATNQSPEILWARVDAYLNEYVERVVRPRMAAASEGCAEARVAIETMLRLERIRQLLGLSTEENSLLGEMAPLMSMMMDICLREEFEMCRDEHVIHRILPIWLSITRQAQLLGLEGVQASGEQYVEKCLRFTLALDSTGTFTASEVMEETLVTSEVPLRFNADELIIDGEGPLENDSLSVTTASPCVVDSVTLSDETTFTVTRMAWVVPAFDPSLTLGTVTDVRMNFVPGATNESATQSCEGGPSVPAAVVPWTSIFGVANPFEYDVNGFIMTGWTIEGDVEYARRITQGSAEGLTESGEFVLRHVPAAE
jgi:hypothetical protein